MLVKIWLKCWSCLKTINRLAGRCKRCYPPLRPGVNLGFPGVYSRPPPVRVSAASAWSSCGAARFACRARPLFRDTISVMLREATVRPTQKPRQGLLQEPRQEILRTAARLFQQQGYDATSMNDVAADLDYASPASHEPGYSAGMAATEKLYVVNWNTLLLYPEIGRAHV